MSAKQIRFDDMEVEWVTGESVLYEFTLTANQIKDGWMLMFDGGNHLDGCKGFPKIMRPRIIDGQTWVQVVMVWGWGKHQWAATSYQPDEKFPEWEFQDWQSPGEAMKYCSRWKPGSEWQILNLKSEVRRLKTKISEMAKEETDE